jgi:hypothetical protein
VHSCVAVLVEERLPEDLHADGSELLGGPEDVLDQLPSADG